MIRQTVNRLHTDHFVSPRDGDTVTLYQTHTNDPKHAVGRIELRGDEIEDAIYLLTRAKERREFEKELHK